MFIFYTIIILGLAFIAFIFTLTEYLTHKGMTLEDSLPINKTTYDDFKFEFNLISDENWEYNPDFSNSLFYRGKKDEKIKYKAYLHANKIIFYDKSMLLNYIDFFLAQSLIRKKIKKIKNPMSSNKNLKQKLSKIIYHFLKNCYNKF